MEKILNEADDLVKKQLPENSQQKRIVRIMQEICDTREVNIFKSPLPDTWKGFF